MISLAPPSNDYLEFSRRLRQLHALIRIGKGESDEAEAIRDDMDDFYMRLNPEEIDRLNLLSSDLNSIGGGPTSFVSPTTVEEIARKYLAVSREVDPEKIRHFLGSEATDPSWNAYIRLLYWSSLGDLEAVEPFAQFILACLEKGIIEVQRHLLEEREGIKQALISSNEPASEDLRQRAEHLQRSNNTLQQSIHQLDQLRNRVGRLDEYDQIQISVAGTSQDSEADTQEIKESLIALISGFSAVSHAA